MTKEGVPIELTFLTPRKGADKRSAVDLPAGPDPAFRALVRRTFQDFLKTLRAAGSRSCGKPGSTSIISGAGRPSSPWQPCWTESCREAAVLWPLSPPADLEDLRAVAAALEKAQGAQGIAAGEREARDGF